ncbi:MAG TPA: hypothetical protein VMP67_11780 [Candidatus Limnocylindria bacterium]|nr:hypothetical protein [Candidatus Limnocylindria bacterium]
MTQFAHTRPPAGRLTRLGVVIDARDPGREAMARLCDRAGLGAVWLDDLADGDPNRESAGLWPAAVALAGELQRASLGVTLRSTEIDLAQVTTMALQLADRLVGRFELSLAGADPDLVRAVRASFASSAENRRPRVSATAAELADLPPLLQLVDDIVLRAWNFSDLESAADEARAEALELGRSADTLGVAVTLPVSIGRTEAEASARADRDAVFARLGHPRDIGIFGTLEDCQDRVIALAHAGVTDLRAILPSSIDVHDVIAQLTAMTVGTIDVLVPGSLRSPAPPPPAGWGGRPDRPPTSRVSGGSRRR